MNEGVRKIEAIATSKLLKLWITACLCLSCSLCAEKTCAQSESVEIGNLVIDGIPEIPGRIRDQLSRHQSVRSASLQGWLPGGEGLLIKTRFGETVQVHLVDRPGGARRQLTFFDEPIGEVAVSPNQEVNGFLFTSDVGGSERHQIFFCDLETGDCRMLTDGRAKHGSLQWSNSGRRFAFYTTHRNGRDLDLHVADIQSPERSVAVLESVGYWKAEDWSPDDRKLLVSRYVSINEVYPYVLDVDTGELVPFNPQGDRVAYGHFRYAKDGQGIYFTSDQDTEFLRLRRHDLIAGETTVLTQDIPWDVEEFALSDDGRYLAFVVNQDGLGVLHVMELPAGREIDVPPLPMGRIYGLRFHSDGRRIGMVLNTPQTPGDVYSLDLITLELVRWTQSETGGLKGEDFVVPRLVRYQTFDRVDGRTRTIPLFYYRPKGEGPFPVLIDIHGGPESQARPTFSAIRQYYVNQLGIALLRPNVRGSKGYGKGYVLLDNGFKREDSVRDIGALLDWIDARPELDGDRVAVMGRSYGGYMVLAALTHYSDRLRAGIDQVGISNFVTFLENTGDYRRDLRRMEYGDERDPQMREFLIAISPTTQAGKITRPLFIAQGLNDPRVPVSESEQMVETIRGNGGVVWYLLAKDEGHGLSKKSNRDYFEGAAVLFLERFLLDGQEIRTEDR